MNKYNNILLAPKDTEGSGGGVSLTNSGGQTIGTLSEDGDNKEVIDNGDTSANLDTQTGAVDLKDIFGDKDDNEKDNSSTRLLQEKTTKVADGVEAVVDETLVPTKEELATKAAVKAATKDTKVSGAKEVVATTDEQKKEAEKKLYESRDYTNLSEEDVSKLKKLPNAIYNHVAPLVREAVALKAERDKLSTEIKKWTENPNRVPDNWYQSPQAYTLTPEFNDISSKNNRAVQEANFYEQQLIAIKGGAKEVQDLGYNPQTGQYFVKGMLQATPELEVGYQRAINDARGIQQQCQQQATNLATKFTESANAHTNYYGEQDKYFNQLPEALRPDDATAKPFADILHPFDKTSPVGKLAAKMYAVIVKQGAALKAFNDKKVITERNKDDQRKAGPGNNRGKNGISSRSKPTDEEDEVNLTDLVGELKGDI